MLISRTKVRGSKMPWRWVVVKNAYDEVLEFLNDQRGMIPEDISILGHEIQERYAKTGKADSDIAVKFLYVCRRIRNEMSYKACAHLLENYFTIRCNGSVYYEFMHGTLQDIVGRDPRDFVEKEKNWTSRKGKLCDSDYVVEPPEVVEQCILILGQVCKVVVVDKFRSVGKSSTKEKVFKGLPPVKNSSTSSRSKVDAGEQVYFQKIFYEPILAVGNLLLAFEVVASNSDKKSTIVAHSIEADAEIWQEIFKRLAKGFDKNASKQESDPTSVPRIVLSRMLFVKLRDSGIISDHTPSSTN